MFIITGNFASAEPKSDPRFAYGEYLSSQCATCHVKRKEGIARLSGVPDIWSMDYKTFSNRFLTAKAQSRNETVLLTVRSLSKSDIDAILYYFEHR